MSAARRGPQASLAVRVMRGTGTVFIVLGAVILYFVVYELFGTSLQTRARQSDLRQEFALKLAAPFVPGPSPTPSATPTAAAKPKVNGIAELIIPRIGVDVIVVQGVLLSDLAYGPGHYPDSAPLGGTGVTAIAGHRTGWGSPFIRLDELELGDLITIKTAQATYTYRVTRGNLVVAPVDYWVVQEGDRQSKAAAKLTLTTCTPKYTSKNRLIVFADLIKTERRVA